MLDRNPWQNPPGKDNPAHSPSGGTVQCPHCRALLRPLHPSRLYRCGVCGQTFRSPAGGRSRLAAPGVTHPPRGLPGAQSAQDRPSTRPPAPGPQAAILQQAAVRARTWLDELDYWAAQGLVVSSEAHAQAQASFERNVARITVYTG